MKQNDKREILNRLVDRVVQYAGRQKQFWNGYWYAWNDKKGDYVRGFRDGNRVVVKTLTEDKKDALEKLAADRGKEALKNPSSSKTDSLPKKDKKEKSSSKSKKAPAAPKPSKEDAEASSPIEAKENDNLDAVYGSSSVWSSPNALVFSIETDDGERITAIPFQFASEEVVDKLQGTENDFNYVPDLDAFLKEGDFTQEDYDFLCGIGAIDKETHKFDDGRNAANIDEERHKYLRDNDILGTDLPQFAPKKPEPPKEEPKPEPKEEPKAEPEPEPKEEPKPDSEPEPEPAPKEEPKEEPKEREYAPALADVFALSEGFKDRYDVLCDSLADIDKFQAFAFETFGESFKPDEIKTLRDAKEAIENPDILPDFRGRILIEAYHFARETNSFTLKKTKPDDLREVLSLTDNTKSFSDVLQAFKWTPWAFTLTPRAQYTAHSREEAIKAVYPYRTIPFLSYDQNAEIRSREKKLLELANAPTTSNAEALYVLSQLGDFNATAERFLKNYKDLTPKDGEDELFDFRKKNLFNELTAIEEKTKILRERAAKAEPPKEEPKEPPKEEPKPEPEPVTEPELEPAPTTEPEPEPEPEKEIDVPKTGLAMKTAMKSSDYSYEEKDRMLKAWAKQYFPEEEDQDDGIEKTVRDFLISDDVPLYAKMNFMYYVPTDTGSQYIEATKASDCPSMKERYIRDRMATEIKEIFADREKSWDELIEEWSVDGWPTRGSVFVHRLADSRQKRYQTRELAIKNARGLVSMPSVLTPKEKQSVLDYINYVGEVAKSPATSDYEVCMLLSDIYWCGKFSTSGTQYAVSFKERAKANYETLREIAARNPELADKEPKWLKGDEETATTQDAKPSERRNLNTSLHTAANPKEFLSCVEQVRSEIMTEEEAQADREYADKLTLACNRWATGESSNVWMQQRKELDREESELQDKQKEIIEKFISNQTVRDYYDKEVLPDSLEDEVRLRNERRQRLGGEPLDEEEIEKVKSSLSLETYANSRIWGYDTIIKHASDAINENSSYYKEDDAAEIKNLINTYDGYADRIKQIKEDPLQTSSEDARIVVNHEGYTYNHKATCAFLEKAFPDRGGEDFFTKEWIDESLATVNAKNKKLGEVARQVFEAYNIIARSFFVGGRSLTLPVVRLGAAGGGRLGFYNDSNNTLVIDLNKTKNNFDDFRETLAHELGHWLEYRANRATANSEWLKSKTGTLRLYTAYQWNSQRKKTPHLTVRPDGYGLRVYGFPTVRSTELVSTGMEYLVRCAAMYAKRSPEHFDLLIRNFEEYSV